MKRYARGRYDRSTLSLGPVSAVLSMDNVLLLSSQRATRAGLEILPRYAYGATGTRERKRPASIKRRARVRERERDGLYPIQNP